MATTRADARGLLEAVEECCVVDRGHPALGVVHHHRGGAEQVLGDHQRSNGVVGDRAAGVAEQVAVADFETEQREQVEPSIHAGDDGDPARPAPPCVPRARILP